MLLVATLDIVGDDSSVDSKEDDNDSGEFAEDAIKEAIQDAIQDAIKGTNQEESRATDDDSSGDICDNENATTYDTAHRG